MADNGPTSGDWGPGIIKVIQVAPSVANRQVVLQNSFRPTWLPFPALLS